MTLALSSINTLPPGMRINDIADACRNAALAFAWSGQYWTKRELADWLVGPYAKSLAANTFGSTPRFAAGTSNRSAPASGIHPIATAASVSQRSKPIASASITRLLTCTHAETVDLLRSAWSWRNDASFAREMIDEGLVMGVVDETSAIGYAPTDRSNMKLATRIRALFLSDFLTRPNDYDTFNVCSRCARATFGFLTTRCCAPADEATLASVRKRDRSQTFSFGLRELEEELDLRLVTVSDSAASASPPPPETLRSFEIVDLSAILDELDLELGLELGLEIDFTSCEEQETLPVEPAEAAAPMIEVLGELEIDIEFDFDELGDDDIDDFGDLRDTIIDPIEASSLFRN